MGEISHFSHDHLLSVSEAAGDDEDPRAEFCKICGLPILSTPSYTCTLGCQFWLHKPCALKIPKQLNYSHHIPGHTLSLEEGSGSPNMVYECEARRCDFRIHPLVAVGGVEIKIKHQSHLAHPLVACCKEVCCECDACGREHTKGIFFWCEECNFWVHPDCTSLPTILKLASYPQPFLLAYSLPHFLTENLTCLICLQPRLLISRAAIYYSPQLLDAFAHARCARDKHQQSEMGEQNFIQLPREESFPSAVIRMCDNTDEEELAAIHKHPLVLQQHQNEVSSSSKLVCDVCAHPISNNSSLFYRCDHQLQGCPFLVHEICAHLFPILMFHNPFHVFGIRAQLYPELSSWFFNSVFHCLFCHRPCNGLCFHFPEIGEDAMPLPIDVECMGAPFVIKHASHPRHLLFRTFRLSALSPLHCCPKETFIYDVYRCILCDYYIHVCCAMLRKTVRYRQYHHHPLHLVFTNNIDTFCEVCEGDIDPDYWVYGCGECDQWFHINCIPSVGYLSKVKFGGTLRLPQCHPDHPLTLTRMLTLPSRRCGRCHLIIQGLLDQMAFSCSLCHFWIHFSCARDSVDASLRIYSQVDDHKLCILFRAQFGQN